MVKRRLGAAAVALALCVLMGMAVAIAAQPKVPLMADVHGELGLDCEACHTGGEYGEVDMDTCLECHGPYGRLAELTAGVALNPHDSHYLDPDCNLCHHGHQPAEDFCSSCHEPVVNSEKHMAVGVGCSACHGAGPKTAQVESERCLACHGPREALAAPHAPYHDGVSCASCHPGHTKSSAGCSTCH